MVDIEIHQAQPEDVEILRQTAIAAINIITGNIFSLVFGILSLVFYNQPEVQSYFAYRNGSPTSPLSYQ